jgi:hypothetical protein
MKQFLFFVFLIFNTAMYSQNEELYYLKGRIICQNADLTTIVVENKRSGNITNSEKNGNFSMFVKLGDKLLFQGLAVNTKEIEITKEDLEKKMITVSLFASIIPLEDVDIKAYPHINAVSLGILQKPAKKYTPAERRLKVATSLDAYALAGLGGGVGFSLDPIINAISGRTAMLKNELLVERKELTIKKIEDNFKHDFFTEKLKIPNDYVKAFLFYVSDNEELREALEAKNKNKIEFLFLKLANDYTTLLNKNDNEIETK